MRLFLRLGLLSSLTLLGAGACAQPLEYDSDGWGGADQGVGGSGGLTSTGGAPSGGGGFSTGGAPGTGGTVSTGGSPSTGGAPSKGGAPSAGGSGGAPSVGGSPSSGGSPSTGGAPSTGGTSSGGSGSGGSGGSGGSCTSISPGGESPDMPLSAVCYTMTFDYDWSTLAIRRNAGRTLSINGAPFSIDATGDDKHYSPPGSVAGTFVFEFSAPTDGSQTTTRMAAW